MSESQAKIHKKKPSKLEKSEKEGSKSTPSAKIKSIMKSIKKTHSLRPIMSFMKIFRAILNEENNESIVIEEGDIFNEIMKFSLTILPDVLKDVLNLVCFKDFIDYKKNFFRLEDLKNFMIKNKKLEIILKVFLSNLYKFLCKLQEEEMIVFLLKLLPNISELIIINVFFFSFLVI